MKTFTVMEPMTKITGNTLVGWGYGPGPHFKTMLGEAEAALAAGWDLERIREHVAQYAPKPIELDPALQHRTDSTPFGDYLGAHDEDAQDNYGAVTRHMDALMRTPTLMAGAIMPDACPAGNELGTIPVGGVVQARNAIHPGFHSADICCSMNVSFFKRDMDVSQVLDIAQQTTHFGFGHRTMSEIEDSPLFSNLSDLVSLFENNPFLAGLERFAFGHFMTQGDGNHFLYVGHLESTGDLAIVTHHGSRALGAELYKRGMAEAKRHTALVSPGTPAHNSWIQADTKMGQDYWAALQIVRVWTRLNHDAIHIAMAQRIGNAITEQVFNEHNFVFQKSDGDFYHAKGATPSYRGWNQDGGDYALIPLNMAEPILVTAPSVAAPPGALGFAPHGAGRLLSRTQHLQRLNAEFQSDSRGLSPRDQQVVFDRETREIDARFFTGKVDLSELPSAYKNADQVTREIYNHSLAFVVDRILPGGAMMAGNTSVNWRDKKAAKRNQQTSNQ